MQWKWRGRLGKVDKVDNNVVITVQKGDSITIDYTLESKDVLDKTFDIFVQDNAQLKLFYTEKTYCNAESTIRFVCNLQRSSTLELFFVSTVLGKSKHEFNIQLNGKGACAKVYGVSATGLKGTSEIITSQEHNASDTTSDLIVRSAVGGASRALYQGNIYIDQNAFRTQAAQKNKALLLSSKARARSVPGLEVLNNDVQCSHGSAIGQFDEDQLWYLQSRGIELKNAQRLLLEGFVGELIPHNNSESMQHIFNTVYKQEK